jgi:hypothetical protein
MSAEGEPPVGADQASTEVEAAKEVAPAAETVEVGAEAPAADAQSSEEAPGDVTGDGGADTAAGQEPAEDDTGAPEGSDVPPSDPPPAPGQPEESGGGGEKPTEAPAGHEGAGESLEQGGGADGELPASDEGEREGQALPAKTDAPPPASAKQAAPDSSAGEGQADAPGAEQGDPEDDLPPVVEVKIASDTKLGAEMKQLGAALHRSQPWKTRAVALRRLRGLVRGGAVASPLFAKGLMVKEFVEHVPPLFSELRSQLVKEAGDFAAELAADAAARDLVKQVETFCSECVLPEALKATTRSNPAIVASADACVTLSLHPSPARKRGPRAWAARRE